MYITYIGVIQGLSFNESIRTGRLRSEFKHKYFIIMHIIYCIQMALGVYFDNEATSENYCTYNLKNLDFHVLLEPFTWIVFYPLMIAWTFLAFINFYGAFVLNSYHFSDIMQPMVRRLRYYIVLIETAVVSFSIYIIANFFFGNANYLLKVFLLIHSIVIALYQLDYFLFVNPLTNQTIWRQRRVPLQEALNALNSSDKINMRLQQDEISLVINYRQSTTWLHLLFIIWDQLMYGSFSSTNSSSQRNNVSCELPVSESMPPSEYYRDSANSST